MHWQNILTFTCKILVVTWQLRVATHVRVSSSQGNPWPSTVSHGSQKGDNYGCWFETSLPFVLFLCLSQMHLSTPWRIPYFHNCLSPICPTQCCPLFPLIIDKPCWCLHILSPCLCTLFSFYGIVPLNYMRFWYVSPKTQPYLAITNCIALIFVW